MDSLVKKLDEDLEEFITQKILESKNKPRDFNFENKSVDEIAEEMKQHPAFMTEFDETKPMSPAMEALQVLKYESQSNDDNATSYKEDGNKNFERKKYRWAIDNYSAGLNCKPTNSILITVLYTNRAAANYHIGNYRSSLNDCMSALKITKDHKKAWLRAIDCYLKLEKYKELQEWTDKALKLFPTEAKLQALRLQSEQKLKELERNNRKQKRLDAEMKNERLKIVQAIKHRKIPLYKILKVENNKTTLIQSDNDDDWLEVINQSYNGSRVEIIKRDNDKEECESRCKDSDAFSEDIELVWPVTFLYPEYGQSDFILAFHENSKFEDHLEAMFGVGCEPPCWDLRGDYKPQHIQIYYEERNDDDYDDGRVKLHELKSHSTLLNVLQSKKYKVTSSHVTILILVKDSEYEKLFIKNYS